MPDTVYVIGSIQYGEQPCDTKGVGCGNGRSNGRAVLYSTTAGDPGRGPQNSRTFTDLTYDARISSLARWCAYAPYFPNGCVHAPNGIHPGPARDRDQPVEPDPDLRGLGRRHDPHERRRSPTSRRSATASGGTAAARCRRRRAATPPASGCSRACRRSSQHIDQHLSSTIQFINVAINPFASCEVSAARRTTARGRTSSRLRPEHVQPGDLRRRRQRRLRRREPELALANEFTAAFSDSNFENGDPTKWVIQLGADREQRRGGRRSTGRRSATRTRRRARIRSTRVRSTSGARWAFGAGHPGARAAGHDAGHRRLRGELPEFVDLGRTAGLRRLPPLGGPRRGRQRRRPDGTLYGTDRTGGSISWIARDSADHGTLWAATSAGRIFVTHNADATRPGDRHLAPDRQLDAGARRRGSRAHLRRPGRPEPCVDLVLGLQRGRRRRRRATCSTSRSGSGARARARSRT